MAANPSYTLSSSALFELKAPTRGSLFERRCPVKLLSAGGAESPVMVTYWKVCQLKRLAKESAPAAPAAPMRTVSSAAHSSAFTSCALYLNVMFAPGAAGSALAPSQPLNSFANFTL